MTKLRKIGKVAALALAISAGFGGMSAANAAVQASALLELTNFRLEIGGSIIDLANGQITPVNITDKGNNTTTLNGVTLAKSGQSFNGAALDTPQSCLGACTVGDNVFSIVGPLAPGNPNYVRSDSNLSGAPILGLPAPLVGLGATAQTITETILTNDGSGKGNSDLTLLTTFTFNVQAATQIDLLFDAYLQLEAYIDPIPQSNFGSTATAASNLQFTLVGPSLGAAGYKWTPNGSVGADAQTVGFVETADPFSLSQQASTAIPGFSPSVSGTGGFGASVNLGPGIYTFSITHGVVSEATQVPEPGTLLLLGAGILGLGLSRRGKKVSSAS